jgi:hypothetical protein
MSLNEIHKRIAETRARRPNGYATRCELCRFWEADDPDDASADEDQLGDCHRYAPRIVHHHSAEALGLIAWAVEEIANVEHDKSFDYGFEGIETSSDDWPRMRAAAWCGEFQERL